MEIGPLTFAAIPLWMLHTRDGLLAVYCAGDGPRIGHLMPCALVMPSVRPDDARALLRNP